MTDLYRITMIVNSQTVTREIDPRLLLVDFIRHELGLTGSHVGCEHGVCGACTVLMDGAAVRSCIMFAVQADGHTIRTVEDLGTGEADLHPLQTAFWEAHGLQCGFCTPGIVICALDMLSSDEPLTDEAIRHNLAGNICRCTGYQLIVDAIKEVASA